MFRSLFCTLLIGLLVTLAGGCSWPFGSFTPRNVEQERMIYPSEPPYAGEFVVIYDANQEPDEFVLESDLSRPQPSGVPRIQARPVIPPIPAGPPGEVIAPPPPIYPTTQPDEQP